MQVWTFPHIPSHIWHASRQWTFITPCFREMQYAWFDVWNGPHSSAWGNSSHAYYSHLINDKTSKILNFLNLVCWQGWVIISDKVGQIEIARTLVTQLRWEARVIDLQDGSEQRLLVCQKPFLRKWGFLVRNISPSLRHSARFERTSDREFWHWRWNHIQQWWCS